jgi:hypothetical protein
MTLKDYSSLPDYMNSDDIALNIEEILTLSTDNQSIAEVAQALLEMVHRQGQNYGEKLPENLIIKIKHWVVNFWDCPNWDLFKITSAIIVNLDIYYFPEGYRLLEQALNDIDGRVSQRAREGLSEMTDTYSKMNSLTNPEITK